MNMLHLGKSDLIVSRLAYGCMRIALTWDKTKVDRPAIDRGIAMLEAADAAGFTFYDHADIYCAGACEMIYGEALKKHPEWRKRHVVATKCGIRFGGDPQPASPHRYDFSREHILSSAEASLKRLNIETIDLYQLHRPDVLANPEEVASAFETLHQSGKVRYFGVSNFKPSHVRMLQAHCRAPLLVNQVEIHLLRLDCLEDGTLDQCLETGMTPLSWSPVAQGRLTEGHEPGPDPLVRQIHAELDVIAKASGVGRAEVASAWLMAHPANIIPIVGTTKPDRIKASLDAFKVPMDRETWYRLYVTARGRKLP